MGGVKLEDRNALFEKAIEKAKDEDVLFLRLEQDHTDQVEVKSVNSSEDYEFFLERLERRLTKLNVVYSGNAFYFIAGDKLYYLNKTKRALLLLKRSKKQTLFLDHEFGLRDPFRRRSAREVYGASLLTKQELNQFSILFGHKHPQPLPPSASVWQQKNGCDLLLLSEPPSLATLGTLAFTNAAYLRYKNRLWYANKTTNELIELLVPLKKHGLSLIALTSSTEKLDEDSRYEAEHSCRPILLRRPNEAGVMEFSIYGFRKGRWQEKKLKLTKEERAVLEKLNFIDNAEVVLAKDELRSQVALRKLIKKQHRLAAETLKRFDQVMKVTSSHHRHLSDKDLERIKILIGHLHRTRWQKFLSGFGYFCSAIIAVGYAISIAGAFISLNLLSGGLAGFFAFLLFVAGTGVNWFMYKKYVSPVLIDFLGREKFLVDEDGDPLPLWKKIVLIVSLMFCLSVGATFGALAYSSTFTLSTAFTFLAAISPAFPPLAAVLAGVTFICLTALTIKDLAELIKKKDVIGECKKFLKNFFSTDPNLPQNLHKERKQIVWERIITGILTVIFIPFAAIGLFMTMNACAPGVKAFILDKIPTISAAAVELVSKAMTLAAFIGQMPFGVKTIFQGVARIFGPKEPKVKEPTAKPQPQSKEVKAWNFVKLGKVVINAFGGGLIALVGAIGSVVISIAAFISATVAAYWTGRSAITPPAPPLSLRYQLLKRPCRSYDDMFLEQRESNSLKTYSQSFPDLNKYFSKPVAVGGNSSSLFHAQAKVATGMNGVVAREAKKVALHAEIKAEDDICLSYSR